MTNLTISIDEKLIKQARIRVAQQGTSLSAKVRELLLDYVNGTDSANKLLQQENTAKLMATIEAATQVTQNSLPATKSLAHKTLREELYEGDFRGKDRARLL
jgi:plasmid stability protein